MPHMQGAINAKYRERFAKQGHLYATASSRDKSFDSVAWLLSLSGEDILDVGCGNGDFVQYLIRHGIKPKSYHGVDIVPELIAAAGSRIWVSPDGQHRFGNVPWATFDVDDDFRAHAEQYARHKRPTVVLAIGLLAHKFIPHDERNYRSHILPWLMSLYNTTSGSMAATLFSTEEDLEGLPDETLVDPARLYTDLKPFVRRMVLDDSYAHHCFTLACYKKGR